jgi:hypothetical protein
MKEVAEDKQIVSKCMSLATGASSLRSRGYAFGIAAVVFPEAKDHEKETLERPVFINKPLLIHHCSEARLELNAKFLFLQLKRVRKPQQLPGSSCCEASPPATLLFLRARAWQIRRGVGRMCLSTSTSSGSRRHLSGVDDDAGEYSFKRFRAQWGSSTGFSEALDPTRIDGGTITLAPEERLALPNESFANASAELCALRIAHPNPPMKSVPPGTNALSTQLCPSGSCTRPSSSDASSRISALTSPHPALKAQPQSTLSAAETRRELHIQRSPAAYHHQYIFLYK